jgi:hypothetical protein
MPSKGAKSDTAKVLHAATAGETVGPNDDMGNDKIKIDQSENNIKIKIEGNDKIQIDQPENNIKTDPDEANVENNKIKLDHLEHNMSELRYVPDGTVRVRSVDSGSSRSAVVLAINHKPINCTEDG